MQREGVVGSGKIVREDFGVCKRTKSADRSIGETEVSI